MGSEATNLLFFPSPWSSSSVRPGRDSMSSFRFLQDSLDENHQRRIITSMRTFVNVEPYLP